MAAACALEHVHTYSLIHDDLPAMDDDDFRRGRPTSHKVFGEAEAILAGDALLTRAFELVVSAAGLDPAVRCRMVRELAVAAGGGGMVGGQWDDIRAEGRPVDEAAVLGIHRRKTGALIRAALRLGAMAAGASPAALGRLTRYGESLGALFQIVDDILDVEGTMEEMGKTPGSDVRRGKATYPAVAGMERARAEAARHATEALDALRSAGPAAWVLREMVTLVRERRG
jgi:geranylgeranyl diphosphate synthase type II